MERTVRRGAPVAAAAPTPGRETLVPLVAVGGPAAAASIALVPGPAGWLGGMLALVMVAIAVVDARRFVIPDGLNAVALALGLIDAAVTGEGGEAAGLAGAGLRAAVVAASFHALWVVYLRLRGRQGLGLGDVKLAAVAGAWLDATVVPVAIELAALAALAAFGWRHYVRRRPVRRSTRLPFGLFFAPAIWLAWLLQATLLAP